MHGNRENILVVTQYNQSSYLYFIMLSSYVFNEKKKNTRNNYNLIVEKINGTKLKKNDVLTDVCTTGTCC